MSFSPFAASDGRFRFELDPATGGASLTPSSGGLAVWTGSLHPALVLQGPDGTREVSYAQGVAVTETTEGVRIDLELPGAGRGSVDWDRSEHGAELRELRLTIEPELHLVDLYFGLSPLTEDERSTVPDPDYPEWPDWRSAGFCVPSARPAPAASFLRSFDLGHARVALGQFGPALGSPYGAAFPRPVYAAAFGDDRGWLLAGVGTVPDAALTLELRSASAAYRWRYREDLWPAAGSGERVWVSPLRLRWATSAYTAYEDYFGSFDRRVPTLDRSRLSPALWNTWGDFRAGEFDISAMAEVAIDMETDVLVIDDGWETGVSTGIVDEVRFPGLSADSARVARAGLGMGFWQSVGWIQDPEASGLTEEDLLHDRHGTACRVNWAMDPHNHARWRYALDPSSPRVRSFLQERTRSIVRELRPSVLKLDFGYGLPGPDTAVPRDPALRGERMGHELYRLIAEAARAEDPDVSILLYGIHPLHSNLADIVSLDDMGDHGDDGEGEGHRHWSVWASLLAGRGVGISASSGYNWEQDDEVVLDTVVLGGSGSVLPLVSSGDDVPARFRARRRAVNRWHRRTVDWQPLWLDSELGSLRHQPRVVSWGRLEPVGDDWVLSALCLRSESNSSFPELRGLSHEGGWGLIAEGESDVRDGSGVVTAIPIHAGVLRIPCSEPAEIQRRGGAGGTHVWSDGVLTLTADESDLDSGLEGWVITHASPAPSEVKRFS